MVNPVFPVSLPQYSRIGYNESIDPNFIITSNVDAGVPKRRKRYTVPVRILSYNQILTTTQAATLKSFYQANAATVWDWVDPDNIASPITCRFTGPPAYNRMTPFLVQCDFQFEVLP